MDLLVRHGQRRLPPVAGTQTPVVDLFQRLADEADDRGEEGAQLLQQAHSIWQTASEAELALEETRFWSIPSGY